MYMLMKTHQHMLPKDEGYCKVNGSLSTVVFPLIDVLTLF